MAVAPRPKYLVCFEFRGTGNYNSRQQVLLVPERYLCQDYSFLKKCLLHKISKFMAYHKQPKSVLIRACTF